MGLFDRLRTDALYNTGAVVQRTGVPADTFRAWERRYGLPAPARTLGNQRLYSDRDIATIDWLRDQTRAGLSISQAVRQFRAADAVDPLPPTATPAERDNVVEGGADTRMSGFLEEVVRAMIDYDAARASRAVEEALALLPIEDVCLHLLQPALYEIGHRWARGEVGISTEHFASAFVIRKLGALFNLSQPEQGRGPIVATCLEGEMHEVGLLLTCLFLSRRGFSILYLGPNLPLDDLVKTLRRVRPPLVLLSASTPPAAVQLAAASRDLRAHFSTPLSPYVPVIGYGGYVFVQHPDLRDEVDGIFLGRDADEAAARIDEVLAAA